MTKLILVKHAMPEIVPGKPPSGWLLSADGRKSYAALAERLREHQPEIIITSNEPKANETGLLAAEALGIPFETAAGLHEHERDMAPFLNDRDKWNDLVADFFGRPGELIFGEETAIQARERFSHAVDSVLDQHPDKTIVIVSHGTVISLYAAQVAGIDPFPLWQRLHLPSYIVLSRPDLEILEVVEKIS